MMMMIRPLIVRGNVTSHRIHQPTVLARQLVRRVESTTTAGGSSSSSSSSSTSRSSTTSNNTSVPILASLASALLGVTVVSVGAAVVELTTTDSCLPYSPQGQRFDQSTFSGRFSRMFLACDPRLLLYTQAQVKQAQALLLDYQHNDSTNTHDRSMDRTLWEARRMVDAAVHPDTGEFIPPPFRMSGYVPFNGPICVAMVAATTTPTLLFWSWVNQSQNALVNYYNRNASSPMSNETLALSYSAAVGSALMVAFGLATAIQKRFPKPQAQQLMKFVAFPSAVVASSLNCYIVRSPEIDSGIPLLDERYNPILVATTTTNDKDGTTSTSMVPAISKVAARQGVYSTTLSRALLQAPVYFLPPLLLAVGPLNRLVSQHPSYRIPLTTALLLFSFGVGLPATTALMPQMASIPAQDVEQQFHHLINRSTQQPYPIYYYNKGL